MIPEKLLSIAGTALTITNRVAVMDEQAVRARVIDELIYQFQFGETVIRPAAGWLIWEIAQELGIYPSSIHPLYMARGRKVFPASFTVPAMNFRGMTYDTSRALFRTAIKTKSKAFICELARGEMSYSAQSPMEYTLSILAGAIKEGYVGPVFIQGDHFQAKCSKEPGVPADGEIDALLRLIEEALAAGFWNIDIDASTLVDLSAKTVTDQQRANIHYTSQLMKFIRSLEPAGTTVSVGGEIGHIGGKNSTVEDFTCFMDGLREGAGDEALISKISVATGTSHGGVVNPDGTMAPVAVDFNVLKEITRIGIEEYGIAGAVQHGASTLPDEMLHEFADAGTAEIHLATGFQNFLMDHEAFPKELLALMYQWLDKTQQQEREAGWTDEQFHYKLRKKCWGQFKKETWDIAEEHKATLRDMLATRFELIFKELRVENSEALVDEHTPINPVHKEIVDFIKQDDRVEVAGLSD
jgi:fructose/tagatose bisphosphate aldolase